MKHKTVHKEKDPLDREIKWLLAITLIAFTVFGAIPYLQAHFIDSLIQYADAAQFHIPPDFAGAINQAGTGVTCPQITSPSSATGSVGAGNGAGSGWLSTKQSNAGGCTISAYVIENSLFPEEFAQQSPAPALSYLLTPTTRLNSGGCQMINIDDPNISGSYNLVDPRLNVTGAYDSIRNGFVITGGFIRCSFTASYQPEQRSSSLVHYNSRDNQTFYSWGMAESTSFSRPPLLASTSLAVSSIDQKWALPIPANHSSNYWQIQEHPMYSGTYPVISDGFFGIDGDTFTMDSGSTNTQRGEVVLFKQFNKTQLLTEIGWDTQTVEFSQFEPVNASATGSIGLYITPDGTKFYTTGSSDNNVYEYSLSVPWDISTSTFIQNKTGLVTNFIRDVHFKPDGTKMVILSDFSDIAYTYNLSTPWDISTSVYSSSNTFSDDPSVLGIWVRDDGLKLYIAGDSSDEINEYNLSIPYDMSTRTYVQTLSLTPFSISGTDDIFFKPDGTRMWVIGTLLGVHIIEQFDLTTPWDISTATAYTRITISSHDTAQESIFFKPDGTQMYFTGSANDRIYQYSMTSKGDTVYESQIGGDGLMNWSYDYAIGQSFTLNSTQTVQSIETGIGWRSGCTLVSGNTIPFIYDTDSSTIVVNGTDQMGGGLDLSTCESGTSGKTCNQSDELFWNLDSPISLPAGNYIGGVLLDSATPTTFTGCFMDWGRDPTSNGNQPGTSQVDSNWKNGFSFAEADSTRDHGLIVRSEPFTTYPDLRVKGAIESVGSASGSHLHVEVKDGNFQAGQTEGLNAVDPFNYRAITEAGGHDNVAYFERNQFMTFMNSTRDPLYSLGVFDLEDPTVGTSNNFDIAFAPNWSNSTNEIVTVFVAVQDNSTSGSMIANVTSIELENKLKYNFTDVTDFVFWEPNCAEVIGSDSPQTDGGVPNRFNCNEDVSNGLTQINQVTAGDITPDPLPTPSSVENITLSETNSILVDWDHNLVNVTGFRIYRTSTEANDTEQFINLLPSGDSTSAPCADSTPSLTPNSYCSQGGMQFYGAGNNLEGKMVADMTWSMIKPSGGTSPSTATFKGAIFNNVVGSGTDFSSNNNSTETYTASTVPAGFTDYTFTFRPPYNSTDTNDGVGLIIDGWTASPTYELEAKDSTSQVTSKGDAYDAGVFGSTWNGYSVDWDIDVNVVNQTKLFYNPYVLNTGNLTTSYVDENVTSGNTYFYRIVPLNGNIEGEGILANYTIVPAPGAVTGLTAIALNATVSLDWNDATFAQNYSISRNGTYIATSFVSNYIDSTVAQATNYIYSVFARNTSGNGTADTSNVVLTNTVPTAPYNLTAAMGLVIPDLEDVFLNWNAPLDNGTGSPSTGADIIKYQVERKAGLGPFSFLANTSNAVPAYEDESVISGANYTWRVRAVNPVGYSQYSNTFSLITTPIMPPNAPTNLDATAVSGSQIDVQWLAGVGGDTPTGYVLQQRHVGFTGFVTIATIPYPTLYYNATGLLPGNTYDYRVRADNGAGSSAYSNIDQAVTLNVPSAPLALTATTINNTAIFLDWNQPASVGSGITKYNIQRESPVGGGFSEIAEVTGGVTELVNGTWQYREHGYSTASSTSVNFACDSNCTGVGGMSIFETITNLGAGSVFKNFPSDFLNNTNIEIEWNAYIQDFCGNDFRVNVAGYGLDYNRANYTQFPFDDNFNDAPSLYDWRSTTNVSICSVDSFGFGPIRYTPHVFTTQPVFLTGPTNSSNVGVFIQHLRSSPSAETGITIFGINITDATSGLTKAYFNTTTTNIDQIAEDLTSEDKQGLFEVIDFTDIVSGTVTDTDFTDTGLTQNTVYNYRVNAENVIGTGPFSNQDNDRTQGVPDAPINLSYTTNGISVINVDWDSPVYTGGVPITGYTIQQAQGIGGTFFVATLNHPSTPTNKTYSGLLQGTNYIYKIAGKNQYGTGAYSANLTAGTFHGPSAPENFNAVFDNTFPYSVFLSWETPLDDGGEPIQGYIVQRKDLQGVYQTIANVTATTFNFTDNSLLQLTTHVYRVAAYGSVGDFTPDQPVSTVVPPQFSLFNITNFHVTGDVLLQQYDLVVSQCFPSCTLTQADIERNGIVESNYAVGEPITVGSTLNFTTYFVIPTTGTQFVNTTAVVTNIGSSGENETGVVTTQLQFQFPSSIFFEHSRNSTFNGLNFTLIRHPVPWDAECTLRGGQPSGTTVSILNGLLTYSNIPLSNPLTITAVLSLQGVGYFDAPPLLNVVPSRNAYMVCEDPVGTQILAFTSFGTGNGTLALTGFTDQLGTFLGVPIPFIFIVIFCAIWTGRSASTGIIFLAVAVGAMGVLGYFDPLTGNPTQTNSLEYFWGFIVFLTILGVFLGKRFF